MTPWRSAQFRRLWVSSLAMAGAQGMERTATAWLVIEAGGGALAVGLALAARSLPSLLLGLPAGTVADRSDRRWQLLAVAGTAATVMIALGALLQGRAIHPWQVAAIALATGCVQVFDTPARQALVLDTVPMETAQSALALNALAGRLAMALGSFVAGLVIPHFGTPRCYLVVAGVYALAAALLAVLRVPQAHRGGHQPPPFVQAMRGAARLLVDVPAIRTLTIAGLACNVFAFSFGSALPIVAHDVLRAGAEGLGTLNAAAAVGGTIAVALLAVVPVRIRREPLLGADFVLYGLALMLLAGMHSLPLAVATMLAIGLFAGAFDILQQTLMQLAVPPAQRGRAVGLWVLSIGSSPVGHIEMGFLAASLGVAGALLINGGLTLLSAAILLVRDPGYRWIVRPKPHAEHP